MLGVDDVDFFRCVLERFFATSEKSDASDDRLRCREKDFCSIIEPLLPSL